MAPLPEIEIKRKDVEYAVLSNAFVLWIGGVHHAPCICQQDGNPGLESLHSDLSQPHKRKGAPPEGLLQRARHHQALRCSSVQTVTRSTERGSSIGSPKSPTNSVLATALFSWLFSSFHKSTLVFDHRPVLEHHRLPSKAAPVSGLRSASPRLQTDHRGFPPSSALKLHVVLSRSPVRPVGSRVLREGASEDGGRCVGGAELLSVVRDAVRFPDGVSGAGASDGAGVLLVAGGVSKAG